MVTPAALKCCHRLRGETGEARRGEITYRRLGVALLSGQVHVELELVLVLDVRVAGFAPSERVDAAKEGALSFNVDHHLCVGAF